MANPNLVPAIVRVSHGSFDPTRFEDIEAMSRRTQAYLTPAIRQLPGLVSYFVGASPSGSFAHVSLWDSEAHAEQMSHLKLMTENARLDAEAAGLTFLPLVNYPIDWRI